MEHLIRMLACVLIPLAFTGCESMNFSRYEGGPRAWPTGSALTEGSYAVPVYRGWLEKPYDVLGVVRFANSNADWNRGDIKQTAEEARKAGGIGERRRVAGRGRGVPRGSRPGLWVALPSTTRAAAARDRRGRRIPTGTATRRTPERVAATIPPLLAVLWCITWFRL